MNPFQCDHFWVQLSTTTDKAKPRRCQCLRPKCRLITTMSDVDFHTAMAMGKVKQEVTFPGIGRW